MNKEYKAIDVIKFIFAIGVVMIHCQVFDSDNTYAWLILHSVLRLAVPFFFCASGFFLYKSLEKSNDIKKTTKKYLKRIGIPFIFWLIMNTPIVVYEFYNSGYSVIKIIFSLLRSIIFYPWGAMWYLLALIVATLLIIPFYKRKKIKTIVYIGLLLYLSSLVFNTYYFVIEGTSFQPVIDLILRIITSARNGVFEGLYFLSIGMYISELDSKGKINYKSNAILLIISYLLLVMEVLLTKNMTHADDHSLFITYIIQIPVLFLFLSNIKLKIETKLFRNYSSGIYFMHRFVLGVVTIFINPPDTIISFLITISIVLIILSILYKINNKTINSVIK